MIKNHPINKILKKFIFSLSKLQNGGFSFTKVSVIQYSKWFLKVLVF